MVNEIQTEITNIGNSKGIILKKEILTDSTFPFKEEDTLTMRIEGNKLIIQKKGDE